MTSRQTRCELWAAGSGFQCRPKWSNMDLHEVEQPSVDMHDIESCLPPRLHAFSRQVLEIYLMGHMSTQEFRRWFHMPNSDYLMLGDCIAQKVDPHYIPEAKLPPSITLKPKTL